MPTTTEAHIITADVLTLLWEGQLACSAAIEELSLWVMEHGSPMTHQNVITALDTLDRNATAITTGILKLRG